MRWSWKVEYQYLTDGISMCKFFFDIYSISWTYHVFSGEVLCQGRAPTEDKIILGCKDSTLILFDEHKKSTQSMSSALVSGHCVPLEHCKLKLTHWPLGDIEYLQICIFKHLWYLEQFLWNCPQMIVTGDKSTLVQLMAWCHQATSHYLSQCWLRSMSPFGVTRPQWVNLNSQLTWLLVISWCKDQGMSSPEYSSFRTILLLSSFRCPL